MANTNGMNPLIPIFNGQAYEFWNIKMRRFFISLDLWDMVENGYAEPTEEEGRLTPAQRNELKDNRKKDAKAFVALQQAVNDSIFPRIAGASSTKEAWNILKKEYQGTEKVTAVKLQTFRREFENLRMKDGESVDEFSLKVTILICQLRSLGEEISEQKIVEKVLRSLPTKFDNIVAAIEESKDLSTYSLTQLIGSLLAHEERLNRSAEKSVEQALASKLEISENAGKAKTSETHANRGRGRGSYHGRGGYRERSRGRSGYDQRGYHNERGNHHTNVQCYFYL